MKTFTEFLNESNITTAVPQVLRLKKALANEIGDAKFAYTTNNNQDGTGFSINDGKIYLTWDSDTGTTSIKQTRAAGGKSLDIKLNVAEKDVPKIVKSWLKKYA